MSSDIVNILRMERTGENRFALLVVCVAGAAIGAAPLALAFGAGWPFFGFTLGVALFTAFRLRQKMPLRSGAPCRTLLEYVLASVSAAFMFALLLTIAAITAVCLYWVTILLNLLLQLFGVAFALPAVKIAWVSGLLLSAMMGFVAATLGIQEMRQQLFPGAHSIFHEMAVVHRGRMFSRIAGVLAIAAAVALVWWYFSGGLGRGFWLLTNFYLIFVAAVLQPDTKRSSVERKLIADVSLIFQKLGWTVAREPRTNDNAIDPLLSGLDIVTSNGERVLGVQVKSGGANILSIDWGEGAGLVSAVRAYRDKRPGFPAVEPVLIMIDAKLGQGLNAFAKEEGLRVVPFTRVEISELLAEDNQLTLQKLAERFLKPVENVSSAEGVQA